MLHANKVALVTGGGSGIGEATALAFAREGAKVAVADIALDSARNTVAQIERLGGQAIPISADVSSTDDVMRMISMTVAELGGLDIAFNNAGVTSMGDIEREWDDDVFQRSMAINASGVFNGMREEIRHMVAHGGGAIVNTASIHGIVGAPAVAYSASKHAVMSATRSAAIQYAAKGVRINAVCPGPILTPLVRALPEHRRMDIASVIPLGRRGEPSEVAEAVVWLSSARASYIVGHALAVDGGFLAH